MASPYLIAPVITVQDLPGLVARAALNKLAQHGKRVHALLVRGGDMAAEGEERLRAGQGRQQPEIFCNFIIRRR